MPPPPRPQSGVHGGRRTSPPRSISPRSRARELSPGGASTIMPDDNYSVTGARSQLANSGKPKPKRRKKNPGDRPCTNCGRDDHQVKDCVKPNKDDGLVHGCPLCNLGNHDYDQCRFRNPKDDVEILIRGRPNHPQFASRTDAHILWLQRDKPLCIELPWSREFGRRVARGEVDTNGFDPDTFFYHGTPADHAKDLPQDPLTQRANRNNITLESVNVEGNVTMEDTQAPPANRPTPNQAPTVTSDIGAWLSQGARRQRRIISSRRLTLGYRSVLGGSSPSLASFANQFDIFNIEDRHKEGLAKGECANCVTSTCKRAETGTCDPAGCRGCDDVGHHIEDCPQREELCGCRPRSGHKMEDCDMACRFCYLGDKQVIVAAAECKKHCANCGWDRDSSMHTGNGCKRILCLSCRNENKVGDRFHFQQDCPKVMCLVEQEMMELRVGERKRNGRTEPLHFLRARLRCKRDMLHLKPFAKELGNIREKGIACLLRDMIAWKETGSDMDKHPLKTRPIIECPECFAEHYEGGNYNEQEPGVLRKPYVIDDDQFLEGTVA
ncbi:hypothetical protein VTJ49DRAFT_4075 [Mycothermus thermophilus]|uniref:CCHC-type domain-containing protein n=1 Tax=Humicola insolens TaxID=85995 RepID=A0ABR3V679_HUMIN